MLCAASIEDSARREALESKSLNIAKGFDIERARRAFEEVLF